MKRVYHSCIVFLLMTSAWPQAGLPDNLGVANQATSPASPLLEVQSLISRGAKRELVVLGSRRTFPVDMLPCPMDDESIEILPSKTSDSPRATITFRQSEGKTDESHRLYFPDEEGDCRGQPRELVVHLSNRPGWTVPRGDLVLWVDSELAEFEGKDSIDFRLMALKKNRIVAETECSKDQSCVLALPSSLIRSLASRDPHTRLVAMPIETLKESSNSLLTVLDDSLNRISAAKFQLPISQVNMGGAMFEVTKLDISRNLHEISCRLPEAIETVSCESAECRMTDEGLRVFHVDPSAPRIKVRYQLRQGYFMKTGARTTSSGMEEFSLDRCAIRIPEKTALLGGQNEHRFFLKIPKDCMGHQVEQLVLETRPPTQSYVKREIQDFDQETRLLEIVFDRVPDSIDRLELTVFARSQLLQRMGTVHIPVLRQYLPQQVRLVLKNIGDVTVIPSNRPAQAKLLYLDPSISSSIRLEMRPGFYRIWTSNGEEYIQGETGVSGSVPLRLAYVPEKLPEFLGEERSETSRIPLAMINTEAVYEVKNVNVPMPLSSLKKQPGFVTVKCKIKDRVQDVAPGQFVRVDYTARDSCSIIFDRDRIPARFGVQRLQVSAGDFNEVISLVPQTGPLYIAVPVGDRPEYATVSISISHDLLSGHYTLLSQQKLGEALRYRIYLSDSWINMSVTTALPTGLFRFGPETVSGSVPLSAGALGRISYIMKSGREFPFSLELGFFGTDLSGDPNFSIVSGIGLGIPVINMNTALQASFNIHAWLEYAPTRTAKDEYPIAFLFGPSFSVGRVSTTF